VSRPQRALAWAAGPGAGYLAGGLAATAFLTALAGWSVALVATLAALAGAFLALAGTWQLVDQAVQERDDIKQTTAAELELAEQARTEAERILRLRSDALTRVAGSNEDLVAFLRSEARIVELKDPLLARRWQLKADDLSEPPTPS